jgi:hypothetical protein
MKQTILQEKYPVYVLDLPKTYADRFVLSFLEAPMPAANTAMEGWARAFRRG